MTMGIRRRTSAQAGFTLVELLVVILIAGVVATAVCGLYLGILRTTFDQTTRIQNQDDARLAMYTMSRLIRAACSSDTNMTSLSDSLVIANPQELVFYVDVDGDDRAERVRYYLSGATLRMQTAEPEDTNPVTYPTGYSTDGIVIMEGVRNGTKAIFTYFGCDKNTTALYTIPTPNTDALRRAVVAITIDLDVNEHPQLTKGVVQLATRVLIRQRYDGGLSGS
jgi:prepilin-type N-terminal cleavage/methylation domain-containing protein